MFKKGFAPLIIVLIIALLAVGCIGSYTYIKNKNKPIACTQEAKICPDGSSVGRIPPNCEFAECPTTTTKEIIPLPCVQEGSSPPLGPNYSNYQCCFDLVLCHNPGENGSICRKTCNPELRMLLWGPERLTIDGLGDYIADVAGGVSPYTYKWSITGPIVIYKWDPNTSSWVPDGNIPENKSSVTYKWTQEGIYKVTVTVTDSTKKTITDTLTVTVKPSYIY